MKTTQDPERAFFIVVLSWVAICLLGAVPLYACGHFPSFLDAFFESVSGFTTTGATVLSDIEALPRWANLWRCATHWIGGLGVIALAVALLPLLGAGGFRLIKAETSGPEKGKFTTRVTDTAKILWLIYFGMTVLQVVLLKWAGFDFFDAIAHAFSTMGTGGFSTRNASLGAFANPAAEWICTVFMLLASVNFTLYYRLFSGRVSDFRRDSELRAFCAVVGVAIVGITAVRATDLASLGETVRTVAFQVASVISTTGFMTDDYLAWRPASQVLLLALFFIGGCSGSTAGGIKIIRWTVLAKQMRNELLRLVHPHGVYTLWINGNAGREAIVPVVGSFVLVYFALVFLTTIVGALGGLDAWTAFTAALSMVGNVGPAFGALGPTANCGFLPAGVKAWYCLAMLAGRLEIYTLIIFVLACVRRCSFRANLTRGRTDLVSGSR